MPGGKASVRHEDARAEGHGLGAQEHQPSADADLTGRLRFGSEVNIHMGNDPTFTIAALLHSGAQASHPAAFHIGCDGGVVDMVLTIV